MNEKYHIVIETKYKRVLWLFRTIEYQRPIMGFSMIEYADGKIYELEKIVNTKIFSYHIEEIECINLDL